MMAAMNASAAGVEAEMAVQECLEKFAGNFQGGKDRTIGRPESLVTGRASAIGGLVYAFPSNVANGTTRSSASRFGHGGARRGAAYSELLQKGGETATTPTLVVEDESEEPEERHHVVIDIDPDAPVAVGDVPSAVEHEDVDGHGAPPACAPRTTPENDEDQAHAGDAPGYKIHMRPHPDGGQPNRPFLATRSTCDAVPSGKQAGAAWEENDSPEQPRRWVERQPRSPKRSGDSLQDEEGEGSDRVLEEVSVAQIFSIHFHHVMARCAARFRANRPMTPEEVAEEIGVAADHWAGDHSRCSRGYERSRCVTDKWGKESALYEYGSRMHLAFRQWLSESAKEMRPYVHGACNWMNESFHSLICKYAPKRILFCGSMRARAGLTVLHWNQGLEREVRATKIRIRRATRVWRGKRSRILGPMDWSWVDDIMRDWDCMSSDVAEEGGPRDTAVTAPSTPEPPTKRQRNTNEGTTAYRRTLFGDVSSVR
ncbi:unnamed protein product [Closterium sp. Yama58-4]|nr:unnamed protein product [Closterium sp. Yama58-4]